MSGGSRKGFPFEREVAKILSLWYTNDERDDVLWRTNASGGRATIRRKAGKTLAGQHGDLTATDPCAKPLTDRVLIEIKRGYKRWSLLDVMDKGKVTKPQTIEGWLTKAQEDRQAAEAEWFWIIAKRDSRQPVIIVERSFLDTAIAHYGDTPKPRMGFRMPGRMSRRRGRGALYVYVLQFEPFLEWLSPEFFKREMV